jgi:hypothetical protein
MKYWQAEQRFVRLASSLTLMIVIGCDQGPAIAPVEGKILLDGKPLAGATITTQPIGSGTSNPGSGSFAQTDDQGQFRLELVTPKRQGAVVGEHRVMISPGDGSQHTGSVMAEDGQTEIWIDDPQARVSISQRKWPSKYTDGSLRLQVPPNGRSDVLFELSSSQK